MKLVIAGDQPSLERQFLSGIPYILTQLLILIVVTGGDALLTTLRPVGVAREIWALLDSPIHAALGVLIAWPLAASYVSRHKMLMMLILAGLASVLIDVDHFLAAGSFSLYSATHLNGRPFTHSLLFALVCGIIFRQALRSRRAGFIVLMALASHLVRDASSGGIPYLIWPFTFGKLPYGVYVGLQLGLSMLAWAGMAVRSTRNHTPLQWPTNGQTLLAPLRAGLVLSVVPVTEHNDPELIERHTHDP